ncbi:MAG: hypothetical protein ABSG78_24385 [Verrucomicrobiota bacterium]|jgi:PhnB protein
MDKALMTPGQAGKSPAARLFAALADGVKAQMPLGRASSSARFGMVADRFGVAWMVLAAADT